MKVLCIKDGEWTDVGPRYTDCKDPVYGDVLTVSDTTDAFEGVYYQFHEIPYNVWYNSQRFIPIQEQETEIEEIRINKLENV